MILIIYKDTPINLGLVNYLKAYTKQISLIEISQLLKIKVLDGNNINTIWELDDKIIDFSSVSGIYNEVYNISSNMLTDYIEEDREYVLHAWKAYLAFVTYKSDIKTFNSYNHYIFSGYLQNLSFVYNECKKFSLRTPKLFLSMDYNELRDMYDAECHIPLLDIRENYDFQLKQEFPSLTVALLEYIVGEIVIVHVVKNEAFGCIIRNQRKEAFQLDNQTIESCIKITKHFELQISEFIFRKDMNDQLYLYRFSYSPAFCNNEISNQHLIYNRLLHYLTNKH